MSEEENKPKINSGIWTECLVKRTQKGYSIWVPEEKMAKAMELWNATKTE